MHGMVLHGKIRTTEAKAKSIQGELEKLVTVAKNRGEAARGLLLKGLANEKVVAHLISEIAPKFVARPGGYTKIMKMGPRVKDGARMVLMTWVEEILAVPLASKKREKNKEAKTEAKSSTKTTKRNK